MFFRHSTRHPRYFIGQGECQGRESPLGEIHMMEWIPDTNYGDDDLFRAKPSHNPRFNAITLPWRDPYTCGICASCTSAVLAHPCAHLPITARPQGTLSLTFTLTQNSAQGAFSYTRVVTLAQRSRCNNALRIFP